MRKVFIWIVVILLVVSMTIPGMLQFFQNQVAAPEPVDTYSWSEQSLTWSETLTGSETLSGATLSGTEQ